MNSPYLSPEINKALDRSNDGVNLDDVPLGATVKVQTCNTLYRIEKRGAADFYIQGHARYCQMPTRAYIAGSTFGGSLLKIGFVGVGMCLEFSTDEHPTSILTSTIQSVHVDHRRS